MLVNNNLCEKFVSSLELQTTFDKRIKVTLLQLFIPDFNLLILIWVGGNFTPTSKRTPKKHTQIKVKL